MKSSMKRATVAILLFALGASVNAQPTADKTKLAGELSVLLGTEEMFIAYLKECTAPNTIYDSKNVFRSNPSYFGGVSPKSAYWPEIEALYRNYQKRICGYVTPTDFSKFFAGHYATALSTEELKSAIRYYSSAGGKKLRMANVSANAAFQKHAQAKMEELYKNLFAEVNDEVLKITQRYKKDPK